ncbi:MAG: ferredoxin family protein [Anaerolineales bacterium]|nr:ferredoxin family protein [Anaerolineales bacterium]
MKFGGKSTKHIRLDTSNCEACWECIDECKYGVLGKVDFWFHKHVIVEHPEKCSGCKRCIDICPHGVFEPVPATPTHCKSLR